ncbi:trehalose-phosphatase [Psychrobacter sp.]|uniref:trehalose-phosphatase n=1 Tax=Psychrobacter sp. TaxID=56811 RepID=UPI0025E8144A|nr:trehalose-phosphatase [Psychrobacter sp.]
MRLDEINNHLKSNATHICPANISSLIDKSSKLCLFLDIDGTLAEFTVDPKKSYIPETTLSLIQAILNEGVNISMVTGRSLIEAQRMIAPLNIPIAATHGLEIDFANLLSGQVNLINDTANHFQSLLPTIDMTQLNHIKQTLESASQPFIDLTIENKPYSCAIHYRQAPNLADTAYNLIYKAIEPYPNWTIKQGKFVWEVVPKGVNKGTAILTLFKAIQQNNYADNKPLTAIFIGDDETDEAGFSAINSLNDKDTYSAKHVKGIAIKVGNESTCAQYYVNNINEVTAVLQTLLLCLTQSKMSVEL